VGLYKETNYSAALAEFRAAYQALPHWETLFNIGLCERRLFKYGLALRSLNQYLADGGPRVPRERRAAVASEIEQIRALTAPVAILVDGPPAQLIIDQEPYGKTPLTEMVPLGSGRHVVRIELEGHAPDERTIEVVSGQPQAVQLKPRSLNEPVNVTVETEPSGALVQVDGAEPVAGPTTLALPPGIHEILVRAEHFTPTRTDVIVQPGEPRSVTVALVPLPVSLPMVAEPRASRPFPVLGVSLLAGGVVAGGLGLFFGLEAQALGQRVTSLSQTTGTWDSSWAAIEAQGRRDSTLGWGLIAGGAALAIAGAAVTTFSMLRAPDAPASLVVIPQPRGALAAWIVRF